MPGRLVNCGGNVRRLRYINVPFISRTTSSGCCVCEDSGWSSAWAMYPSVGVGATGCMSDVGDRCALVEYGREHIGVRLFVATCLAGSIFVGMCDMRLLYAERELCAKIL